MNIFRKAKIYGEAYFAERSGIPLPEFLKAKARALVKHAPNGEPPYFLSVQGDGSVVRAEIQDESKGALDELALRVEKGDRYADAMQKKAQAAIERMSACELDARVISESAEEERKNSDLLVKGAHDLRYKGSESQRCLAIFIVLALGEIGSIFTLFADFFGIDPTRPSAAFLKEPAAFLVALLPSFGFFIASLLIAERVLADKRRIPWIGALGMLAIAIGWMRARQIFALQEGADVGSWLMPLVFTFTAFSFPLAAAHYAMRWREASVALAKANGKLKGIEELKKAYTERLKEAENSRAQSEKELDLLIDEYVNHYQKAQRQKENLKAEWENYARFTESYLAELHIAYFFWSGWRRPGKKEGQAAERIRRLPVVLAFISLLALSETALAAEGFNVVTICDRSSSAGEFACSKENIESAARLWIERAGDTGDGSFEVVILDSGFDSAGIAFSEKYPERFPGPVTLNKKKWIGQLMVRLSKMAEGLPENKGSAIAEAIYRASLRIPQTGTAYVYILSDMRQVNGAFNFERRVPSKAEFFRWLDSRSIKPKFSPSTRLIACGLHPYTPDATSRMTIENYERLIGLWSEVFRKWGVQAEISEVCSFN